MKAFNHLFKRTDVFIVLLLNIFFLISCHNQNYYPCIRSDGDIVEENRIISAFSSVDLLLHSKVFIIQGDNPEIQINAAENVLETIRTTLKGNCLIIENDQCLRTKKDDIIIYIKMPEIKELKVTGSGSIYVDDMFETGDFNLSISGSGNIYIDNIDNKKVISRISGSGNINLSGNIEKHEINISGSGNANCYELNALEVEANVSGSGNCFVSVSDRLKSNISGSGDVYYKGNPSVSSSVNGSGKIIHVN